MGSKVLLKTNYAVEAKYDAYFTGQRVQVTSDGEAVLCECGDGVGVVSLSTGKVLGRIECDEDQVTAIALAPDNSSLVVALKSTSLRQYSWPGLELGRSFRSYHRSPVTTMSWDATSTLLVTGSADSSARVWDLQKKYCTHSLKGASGVFSVAIFHPDLMEKARVYGAASNTIYIWSLEAGSSSLDAKLDDHHSMITTLQLTHDHSKLVSCGLDRVIILWDLETFTKIKVVAVMQSLSGLCLQPPGIVLPGASSDQGDIFALVVGDKGIPSVWEVQSGREVWRAAEPVVTPPDQEGVTIVNQLTHCPALNSFIMTTYDHSILLARSTTMETWKQLAGYNDQILDIAFVGATESHLVVATNSIQLRLYDCSNFNCQLLRGHSAMVLALAVHPSHPNMFASSSHDNTVLVWRLRADGSADCIASAVGHAQSVGCLSFAEDYMVTGSKDTCIKKWTLPKNLNETEIKERISLSSTYTEKAHEKDINGMCVSVNGRLIATGSQDKTAKVWSSENLALVGTLNGHRRGVWAVQFSPIDEILATASADATIRLWTLNDFSNAATLEGHSVSVLRLHWVTQGQQLLSTASDGLVKLWNVRTRQCCETYDEHDDKVWALTVSQDEMKMVTGGEDARLVVWNDVTEKERQQAQEEADRLAAQEQTLANLMKDKKWAKALKIAIGLGQPFRALKVMKELLDDTPEQLPQVISKLHQEQISSLLSFMCTWNTKTKNSREAQSILKVLLSTWLPEELEKLDGWRTSLEALLPYTERHFKRVSALGQSSNILSYMTGILSLPQQPGNVMVSEMSNLDLLKTIPSSSRKEVDTPEGEEDDTDLRAAVQDSILEIDGDESEDEEDMIGAETQERIEEDSTDSEEDEGIEEGHSSSIESEDAMTSRTTIPVSGDDLIGNFVHEKVVASEEEEEEEEEMEEERYEELEEEEETYEDKLEEEELETSKRKGDSSVDQLHVVSTKKKKNKNVKEKTKKNKVVKAKMEITKKKKNKDAGEWMETNLKKVNGKEKGRVTKKKNKKQESLGFKGKAKKIMIPGKKSFKSKGGKKSS